MEPAKNDENPFFIDPESNNTPEAPQAPENLPETPSLVASSVDEIITQVDVPEELKELTPPEKLLEPGHDLLNPAADLLPAESGELSTQEVPAKIASDFYTPTEVVKTVPVFVPHPVHSVFRTVITTLIILLVISGSALAWLQRANILSFVDSVRQQYFSDVLPSIPLVGTGTPGAIPEGAFSFADVPAFDMSTLVATTGFAPYRALPLDVKANVTPYRVNTGLTNVKNREYFTKNFPLKASDEADLKLNTFVVKPDTSSNEFFSLYEENRYSKIPSFISADSILHNYHLLFDHLLKRLEEEKLAFILHSLNNRLVSQSSDVLSQVAKTPWENAARRNLGFFTVGSVLLDPATPVSSLVADTVNQELELIQKKEGISPSPVINQGSAPGSELLEDYTQYIPRGHYDGNPLLEQYFRSMMWYGRLSFRFKNEDEIRSAVLITLALRDAENQKLWSSLSDPIDFFVGRGDDVGYREMNGLLEEVYGGDVSLKSILSAPEKFAEVVTKTKTLAAPQINSMPILNPDLAPDREAEIAAFRFFGQRFTLDAAIFQRLIYREVEVNAKDEKRMLPKGLDILAAFGSEEALSILNKGGEGEYENYTKNMTELKSYIAGLKNDTWTQNLYWGWLYTLKSLTAPAAEGYPVFMRNQAWTRKSMNTFLASWSELKHDTILYAKQVYAELGGGGDDETVPPDDRGYVEPQPELYGRLTSLLTMTREGLDAKKLLSDDMRDILTKMETLTLSLKTISEKELKNQTLTVEEYELIRSYGGQLEHFWMEVNREAMAKQQLDARNFLDQNPAAIIADVATDPNGQVLQVGTGPIMDIYVVVPVDGVLKLTRGGVFSYYEFPWPMTDRLTDKKWRAMMGINFEEGIPALEESARPTQPAWTHTFMGAK